MIPTLSTDRLLLRGPSLADFEQSAAMWADPAVVRFIGGHPSTRQATWSRLLTYIGHWQALGFGYWVITDHAGGFLGEAGLANYNRDMDPPLGDDPEAGWVLTEGAAGRGIATEAMSAVLHWADATLPPPQGQVAIIDPDNLASLKVAAKLGFQTSGHSIYRDDPVAVLRRAHQANPVPS